MTGRSRARPGGDPGPDGTAPGGDRGFELEPHSERRQRQLVEVAAHIIETEGPDAVRMPRVGELAGCTRTLVYRYFPRREDLLAAVLSRFYERLNAVRSAAEHARGVAALAKSDPEDAWRTSRSVLEASWDVVEELGMGGLVLARSEFSRSEHLKRYAPGQVEETERRWFRPLRAAGLSDVACAVALEAATSVTYSLVSQHRAGAISRDEAVRLGFQALHGLIRGLRERGGPRRGGAGDPRPRDLRADRAGR